MRACLAYPASKIKTNLIMTIQKYREEEQGIVRILQQK
jgi:hypothetical protein